MTKSESFDLASIDTIAACNKPFDMELVHPVSRVGLGVFFSLVGKDSDIYRARVRAMADSRLRGAKDDDSLDKLEAKNIDAIVAANVAWWTVVDGKKIDGIVTLGGEKLDFTPANQRTVFTKILPAREQAQEAINDLGNFMPG